MNNQKNSKMGLGLVLGVVLGAIGGVFLAPKSGKENREAAAKRIGEVKELIESGEMKKKIEEVFGEISEESVRVYNNALEEVMNRVEKMKTMTAEDYAEVVQTVIDKVKEGTKIGSDKMLKLKDQFIEDYPEVEQEVKKKARKAKTVAKGMKEN
jgi:gas vesicle protein